MEFQARSFGLVQPSAIVAIQETNQRMYMNFRPTSLILPFK